MRLYRSKDNTIVHQLSQQEAIDIQLSYDSRIPIFRGNKQVGYFDRETGAVAWSPGVEFSEDAEYVSLFKPEQGG